VPIEPSVVSSLLGLLPAVFQEDRHQDDASGQLLPSFLGRFLLAFEKILLGRLGEAEPGLDEVVASIHRYFEPGELLSPGDRAPAEFLPWLAGWLALVLREDWDPDPSQRQQRQRNLIGRASELYRLRGTKRGIEEFVRSYTVLGARVDELDTRFRIGFNSRVGQDTIIDGGAPFCFTVTVLVPATRFADLKKVAEVSRAIVDQQKPAHTSYTLRIETPRFRIGFQSTVGVDTVLGSSA
jgi:phage tail-like protein